MGTRRAAPWVVLLLVLLGGAAVAARRYTRHEPLLARGDSVWRIAYNIDFRAEKGGGKVRAAFPFDTPHSRVFDHQLVAAGLKIDPLRPRRSEVRDVVLVAEQPGEFRVDAQFDIYVSARPIWRTKPATVDVTPVVLAEWLKSERGIRLADPAVAETLKELDAQSLSQAELVGRIFRHCEAEIGPGEADAPQDAAGALQQRTGTPLGRSRAMVALCRASQIPARLVTGFEIETGAGVRPDVWVEVLLNNRWEPYDPENNFAGELPAGVVPVRCGELDIVRGSGVADLRASFSMARLAPAPRGLGAEDRSLVDILDLTRLPLEMHEVMALVLLLPLGALVTSFFRTIIGIRTFGTFTPTLLALAFVYADWRGGLVIFAAVLLMGLASRRLLEWLKLLLIPRLSIVLTLVVLVMVFGVSLLHYFFAVPSAQAVLLPMVIMTMTVERFYVTTEEDGVRFAVLLLAGTLLVAFCCYLTLRWETVGRWLMVYPEAHLFTIAVLMLMGRYTGYRLTELWRFRDLTGPGAP